jgi:hypothetical protein
LSDTIDELTDQLVGIFKASPDFLDQEDANRYTFFLSALCDWKFPSDQQPWRMGQGRGSARAGTIDVRAGNFEISKLGLLLPYWVMSYFQDERQLMPHYALDTAIFIKSMIVGYDSINPVPWRTEPLLMGSSRGIIDFSRSFKREFTQKLDLTVRGIIPPNGTEEPTLFLRADRKKAKVGLYPGTLFEFEVLRCHLSEYLEDQYLQFRIETNPEEPETGRYDIAEDFRLKGRITKLLEFPECTEGGFWANPNAEFDLPARWITHEVSQVTPLLVPLPTWDYQPQK